MRAEADETQMNPAVRLRQMNPAVRAEADETQMNPAVRVDN